MEIVDAAPDGGICVAVPAVTVPPDGRSLVKSMVKVLISFVELFCPAANVAILLPLVNVGFNYIPACVHSLSW